jgi:hypothetical protein
MPHVRLLFISSLVCQGIGGGYTCRQLFGLVALQSIEPILVYLEEGDLLTLSEPSTHLRRVVATIGCEVSVFGIVNYCFHWPSQEAD